MLESWLQISCNGCGSTSMAEESNITRSEYRKRMRAYGWRQASGDRDYCRDCVATDQLKNGTDVYNETSITENH